MRRAALAILLGMALAILLGMFALEAHANGNAVFISGTILGGGGGSSGTGGVVTYVETDSPVSGADPCNNGDTWWNKTQDTFFTCEDGATDTWVGTPVILPCQAVEAAAATGISATNDEFVRIPFDATAVQAGCITIGGTSAALTFAQCTSAGASCATVEAMASPCDSNGEASTAIDSANLTAGNLMKCDVGTVTGIVTALSGWLTVIPR